MTDELRDRLAEPLARLLANVDLGMPARGDNEKWPDYLAHARRHTDPAFNAGLEICPPLRVRLVAGLEVVIFETTFPVPGGFTPPPMLDMSRIERFEFNV